jgi:hypothetical protein
VFNCPSYEIERKKSETSIGERKRARGKIPFNFNYKLNR